MDQQKINITELDEGGAVSAMNEALEQLLENVLDLKTDPKKTRKVSLEVTVKPNEERNTLDVSYQVKPSFAPPKAEETQLLMDKRQGGKPTVTEVRRQRLPFKEEEGETAAD